MPFRDWLGSSNVALILAIVVAVAATFGGRLAGVLTSVAAALAFDFFHTRPYLNLRIDRRVDIIAGFLLLVLGLVVGELAALRQTSGDEAQLHRGAPPTSRMWRRSSPPAQTPARCGPSSSAHSSSSWTSPAAASSLHRSTATSPISTRTGRVDTELLHYESGGFTLPAEGVEVPVSHGGHVLGRLVLVPQPHRGTTRPQRRVAVAIADQFAVALANTQPLEKLS